MKLYSPATVKQIIDKYKFRFQKSLGQNFLIDGNIVNRIVEGANVNIEDVVLEIGAGIGTLTKALAEKASKVVVIELDRNLLPILEETLADNKNIDIHLGNALKTDFDELIIEKTGGQFGSEGNTYKLVANLPYYITTPLVMHALESHFKISQMVFMVQREVAERMLAVAGSKDYGALTLGINYYSEPEMVIKVPRKVFMPQPEVDSVVIRLNIREKPPFEVVDEQTFFRVVRAAFGQRRKTLANALSAVVQDINKAQLSQVLTDLGIDPGRRGETLNFEEFAVVANSLYHLK